MGYAFYELTDGSMAGYGVDWTCDAEGCSVRISRGLDYLCGEEPLVENRLVPNAWGCGGYFCYEHSYLGHDCTRPGCFAYPSSAYGQGVDRCNLLKGHELLHVDMDGTVFEFTEEDDE